MINLNKNKYFSAIVGILILGLITAYSVQSQTLSTIETTELTVGKGVSLQDNKETVTSAFGLPDDINNKHWEMSNIEVENYWYGNSILTFHNRKFISFDIKTSDFVLQYKGNSFKVGDSIQVLSSIFSKSYNNRSNGKISIAFGFRKNGDLKQSDSLLLIGYNSDKQITYIRDWTP